jgi:phospholipid/cholesterol/gamma-HCH transport system substrate-binding protein
MKRRDEVLVGLLLTVGLIIAVIGTIWLSRGGLAQGYPLYARFQWGAGLKQGQQVQLGGVAIGYVDDIELDMLGGTVLVTMRVQPKYQVPQTTTAFVEAYGIFGDQIIAMRPSSPSSTAFEPGDTVPAGKPAPTTAEIIAKVDSIGDNLGDVTEAFEMQLVQSGGIEDLRRSLAGMNRLINVLNTVATEQSRQLTLTQQGLRSKLAALDSAEVDSTVRNLRAASANLAALTQDFQRTSDQLQSVLAKVDSGPGSLPMLLNDPGLYNNLRAASMRLDSLILDVKLNPKKYLPKISVF